MTRPASRSRVTRVASYGGSQPSRIREPAVDGRPRVTTTSLTAIGTPASGAERRSPAARRRSTSAAVASAPSASTCRKAWTSASTSAIRSRWAWVSSTALTSPVTRASRLLGRAYGAIRGRESAHRSVLLQDAGHVEPALLGWPGAARAPRPGSGTGAARPAAARWSAAAGARSAGCRRPRPRRLGPPRRAPPPADRPAARARSRRRSMRASEARCATSSRVMADMGAKSRASPRSPWPRPAGAGWSARGSRRGS